MDALLLDDKNRISAVLCFMKVKELNQKYFNADLECFCILLYYHSLILNPIMSPERGLIFMVCVYVYTLTKMCFRPHGEDKINMRFIVWFQYKFVYV